MPNPGMSTINTDTTDDNPSIEYPGGRTRPKKATQGLKGAVLPGTLLGLRSLVSDASLPGLLTLPRFLPTQELIPVVLPQLRDALA